MSIEKKEYLLKLFKETTEKTPKSNVSISGSNNVVGNNNTIYNVEKHIQKTKVTVEPTSEHITDEQAFKLSELVKEIVKIEAETKKKPSTFPSVWKSVNTKCGVTSYRKKTSRKPVNTFLLG